MIMMNYIFVHVLWHWYLGCLPIRQIIGLSFSLPFILSVNFLFIHLLFPNSADLCFTISGNTACLTVLYMSPDLQKIPFSHTKFGPFFEF